MPDSNNIDLDSPYALTVAQTEAFRRQGFIKLKNVLSPATIAHYGPAITESVKRLYQQHKPLSERNTYQKAFLQVMNIWTKDQTVREFSFSKRLARIAAELMGTRGVRMYHDQSLYKEPGGGITPWHADQFYWPLSSDNCCTAWIPLQATPMDMGPLAFSIGSHQFDAGRSLGIREESEEKIQKALAAKKLPLDEGPFDLGEISFHYGWTFHRAGGNTTPHPRAVMTIIYLDQDMRIAKPANVNQQSDLDVWFPGQRPGDVAASELNPVLWNDQL
jgi:ectoine hydroxylase-related dioxygenase (phytanoyl-CoA dioxygenase family)